MAASNLQGFPNWLLDHASGPQWPSKVTLEITNRKDALNQFNFALRMDVYKFAIIYIKDGPLAWYTCADATQGGSECVK